MGDFEKFFNGFGRTPVISFLALILIFTWPGMGITQEAKECLDCHPEYFGNLAGEFNHHPFEEKDCNACHKFHGFRNAMELQGSIINICVQCHDEILEFDGEFIHAPIADDDASCLNCHKPHSSTLKNLQSQPSKSLCLECHESPDEISGFVHAPYNDTSCVICHNPHGSPFGFGLQMPVEFVCMACHLDDLDDLEPSRMHAARENKNCDNCHSGHRSPYRMLLKGEGEMLCLQCHPTLTENIEVPTRHTVLDEGDCLSCHRPHFEKSGVSLVEEQPDLCFICHDDVKEQVESEGAHAAAEDDCGGCHNPHFQTHLTNQEILCGECHDTEDRGFAAGHLNLKPEFCSECHNPHGSTEVKLLRKNGHIPFAEKDCNICHESGQKGSRLYRNELCLECHEIGPNDSTHADLNINSALCILCHSPHASSRDNLLRVIKRE